MRIKKTLNKGMKPGKANDKKEKEKEWEQKSNSY